MLCRHVRVSGKKFRVVTPKHLKRLPKGAKFLIPSKGRPPMKRKKRRVIRKVRVKGYTRKVTTKRRRSVRHHKRRTSALFV